MAMKPCILRLQSYGAAKRLLCLARLSQAYQGYGLHEESASGVRIEFHRARQVLVGFGKATDKVQAHTGEVVRLIPVRRQRRGFLSYRDGFILLARALQKSGAQS